MKVIDCSEEPTTEDGIYQRLSIWLKLTYPDLIWFFDLSGIRVHQGTKKKIKSLRCAPGIPDLIILEPNGPYHGLMLEIKKAGSHPYKKNGKLKADEHLQVQAGMLNRLSRRGYKANFATGLRGCKELITKYITFYE